MKATVPVGHTAGEQPSVQVTYLLATSREMLAETLTAVGADTGNCLVFADCGHWWREDQPAGMKRTTPRVCVRCPDTVGLSPQGFASVAVIYVPLEVP